MYFSQVNNALEICLKSPKVTISIDYLLLGSLRNSLTTQSETQNGLLWIFMDIQMIFRQNKSFPQAIKHLWECQWQFCMILSLKFTSIHLLFSLKNKNYSLQSIKRLKTKLRWNIGTFRSRWCWLAETDTYFLIFP